MSSRTRVGRFSSPMPGSSITIVPMRANTSMNAAARAGRNEMSMCMKSAAAGDAGGDADHFGLQLFRHERQRDQQRNEDRQDLRHESERHFLDLRHRLQKRNDDADREPDQHDGACDQY